MSTVRVSSAPLIRFSSRDVVILEFAYNVNGRAPVCIN